MEIRWTSHPDGKGAQDRRIGGALQSRREARSRGEVGRTRNCEEILVVGARRFASSDRSRSSLARARVQVSDDARAGRAAEMMARGLPRSADSLLAQSAKLRCLALLLPALAKRGHRTASLARALAGHTGELRGDGGEEEVERAQKRREG